MEAKSNLNPTLKTEYCQMKEQLIYFPDFKYASECVYWVEDLKFCGEKSSDTIAVKSIKRFVPNLITANDDGKNDRFEILAIE